MKTGSDQNGRLARTASTRSLFAMAVLSNLGTVPADDWHPEGATVATSRREYRSVADFVVGWPWSASGGSASIHSGRLQASWRCVRGEMDAGGLPRERSMSPIARCGRRSIQCRRVWKHVAEEHPWRCGGVLISEVDMDRLAFFEGGPRHGQ